MFHGFLTLNDVWLQFSHDEMLCQVAASLFLAAGSDSAEALMELNYVHNIALVSFLHASWPVDINLEKEV